MSDTQWPRYEVFHQEAPDQPHRHAGSVHAPDVEVALLNARDVFVRRPECSSLWVAPEAAITGGTAEQLVGRPLPEDEPGPEAMFLVFAKLDQRGTLTHVGEVAARSPHDALEAAGRACSPQIAYVLWVIPATQVAVSDAAEAGPLFAPARDKPFRDQAYYHTQTALRRLQREGDS